MLSKIITRLVAVRMTEITEREWFLLDTQFGFRKQRATEDAILIFNTVLTEAKLHKIDLGFGGHVYDVIRDIYTGDSLYIQVNGELCKAMYLAQGLKQGCSLSPLFFNLLMIDMAREIVDSNEGSGYFRKWLGETS